MRVTYTKEFDGYPGYPESEEVATALGLPDTYAVDNNGLQAIGAIVTAMVDGIWYTYGGDDVVPVVDTVGHFLAANTNLVIQGRWACGQFRALSDDAVSGAVIAVTYLFPNPPTFTV